MCCYVTIQYLSLVIPQNHFERVFIIVLNPKPNLAQIPEDEGAICLALIIATAKSLYLSKHIQRLVVWP